jgi:hypothetical protein
MAAMIELVFILCAVTSLGCAVLLWRGYRRSRIRLLFWSSLCFFGFAVNNGLRLLDVLRSAPESQAWLSALPALLGVSALIYGLIHDVD